MKSDNLFLDREYGGISSFVFDKRVVSVFDDMVERSVPGYGTIQLLVSDLALEFCKDDWIYDLGCSTGNSILSIVRRAKRNVKILGCDNSVEMVEECRRKTEGIPEQHIVEIVHQDLQDCVFDKSKPPRVVILNLVLQFVRPMFRTRIIQGIYNALLPGGCILLVEKTIEDSDARNSLYIDYYHKYKMEMGYSEIEVSRKREALENKLIPFTREENCQLLRESGFNEVATFFQWINFSGFIATK